MIPYNNDRVSEAVLHGFITLGHMIVLQAVKDYRDALYNEDKKQIESLQKFFNSEWANLLYDNCSYLIKNLSEKVEKFREKAIYLFKHKEEKEHVCTCPICGGWINMNFVNWVVPHTGEIIPTWVISCESCEMTAKDPSGFKKKLPKQKFLFLIKSTCIEDNSASYMGQGGCNIDYREGKVNSFDCYRTIRTANMVVTKYNNRKTLGYYYEVIPVEDKMLKGGYNNV